MDMEQNALGRVLSISKTAYTEISKGEIEISVLPLLDSLSVVMSYVNDKEQPAHKMLNMLERDIKAKNKPFYPKAKQFFSKIHPVQDFDFEKAVKHIPAIVHGNDMICRQFVAGDREKVRTMCDAMKSYPGFLFGEYTALTDEQFYDLVFGYYPKLYINDDFMGKMKGLFAARSLPPESAP